MIIGIDGNEANVEKRVGISEYAFELLRQFKKTQSYNLKFQIYLKDQPREELPEEGKEWRYRVIGPKKLWTQVGLPFDLFFHQPRPQVFFSPTHYAPRFSPIPVVISIMDLSYIHFPQMFKKSDLYQLKNWTSYSVKKAKKVLTISRASKNDIIKEYGIEPGRVVVTYPGMKMKTPAFAKASAGKQNSNMDKLRKKYGISGEYILFVGTLQPRKNIVRLIEAFSKINLHPRGVASQHPGGGRMDSPGVDYLVVVGKKGWLYEEILAAPKKFGVENRVKFLDFVPEDDLPVFYKNALCFVLPSLYEGFGLPILEAMANGCPVVTSNVSSLPEAGGDAALYVNPEDVDDITQKIKLVLENKKLREELIEKGYKQVKKFSWEKTAIETLKVLEEVASER